MIKIERYTELAIETKQKLEIIIENEFGHIPIVRETSWASPDWTIIYYHENEIATFYNVVVREVSIDEKLYKAAGINNVITPENFRGRGFSTKTLLETKEYLFHDLNLDLGLLLCADDLVPFYKRIGWHKVDCPVYFDQPTGKNIWTANTMLWTKEIAMQPHKIDLNGLPW
jgi:hypothetical protein